MVSNKELYKHIELWREELEVKLRSEAVRNVLKMTDNNFNAAKWAADGHWNVKRGRPSKEEAARERKMRERAADSLKDDADRVVHLVKK
jgi:hypothetical protein